MEYKVQGKFNTMKALTYAQARDLTKNNIRGEMLTADIPCDFCSKDFRPSFRNQRFCSNQSKCSDAYWNKKRMWKMQGLTEDLVYLLEKLEQLLLTNSTSRIILDTKLKTVQAVTS